MSSRSPHCRYVSSGVLLRFPFHEIDALGRTRASSSLCSVLTPPVVFTQVCFAPRSTEAKRPKGYCMQITPLLMDDTAPSLSFSASALELMKPSSNTSWSSAEKSCPAKTENSIFCSCPSLPSFDILRFSPSRLCTAKGNNKWYNHWLFADNCAHSSVIALSISGPIMWFVEWGKYIVGEYERKSQKKPTHFFWRNGNTVNRRMQSIHCGVRPSKPME